MGTKVIPPESRRGYNHLPAIDGLRAFAVLSVVAYHAGLPLSAGYVGVDVFFVISGYVITRMLLSEPRIDLLAFYARRVRRILPVLLVVVAAVLALSTLLSADLQIATNRSAMAAMAMGANVWFQMHTGYFDGAADQQPLLHLWSLAVEEQFYLVWPLLLIAFRRRPWVLALLALASLWLAESVSWAFYSMPTRFWELAVGGLLVMLPKSRLGTFAAWLGLAVLCFGVTNEAASFPGLGALLPVFGAALVLHAIHSGARIAPLEWAPVRYVGLVSYSFYLWHWPLLAIAKARSFDPPTLQTNLLLCGLAFVLAALSYHFIETPFRRTNPPKVRAIGFGVAACVALGGCAAALGSAVTPQQFGDRMDIPRECYQVHTDKPALPPASCGGGDVILWGDSHAQAWLPYAQTLGKVRLLSRAACPSTLRTVRRIPDEKQFTDNPKGCVEFNALALEEAKRGKVVILAARWVGLYQGAQAQQGVATVLDALSGGRPRVIVMGPLPVMPRQPGQCISTGHACSMARADFDRQAEPVRAFMREQAGRHPNVEFMDPTGFFCDANVCPLTRDGMTLYYDDDHISASAAKAFATRSGTNQAE